MIEFESGDIVVATVEIWRKDKKSRLMPGDKAKVSRVWKNKQGGLQILDVEIDGQLPMIDIVQDGDRPFRKVRESKVI